MAFVIKSLRENRRLEGNTNVKQGMCPFQNIMREIRLGMSPIYIDF